MLDNPLNGDVLLGLTWAEAEEQLLHAGVSFVVERTAPPRRQGAAGPKSRVLRIRWSDGMCKVLLTENLDEHAGY